MDSKVFNRRFERNTVPAKVCALLSTDSRQDAEPTGIISVLSVFNLSLLLFILSRTSSIHVWNTGLNRKELIGWGTIGQLSVIGVLVIVTIVDRNHIWQRLRVQGKHDRSQHGTLGHTVHKRAGGGHNTINNDWLKTATQIGDKPVEDAKCCLKPFQQYRMVQSVESSTQIKQSHQGN